MFTFYGYVPDSDPENVCTQDILLEAKIKKCAVLYVYEVLHSNSKKVSNLDDITDEFGRKLVR